MAVLDEETIQRIKSQLRHHAKGMMISDLSRAMKINRNIMSKYLDILLMSGEVEMEMRGNAKVYTLSRRVPLSTMFDSSSDCIILLDGKGRMLWLNTALLTLLGKPPEEFAGRHLADTGDPFLQCLPFQEKPDSGETVSEISCPLQGRIQYFRVKQTPAVLANGSMGSILNCEDITAESMYQQMVELSEARFRAIVEDQTEFIVRFLPDGTLTFSNGSFARMTGMEPEGLAGSSFFTHMPEDDVSLFQETAGGLTRDHAVENIECRVVEGNGTVRRQQWTVRALFDSAGNITEYQGVGRDITEQAEAQERLRRHAADMEFISQKAREFLELPPGADIYVAMAEGISELVPDAVICVSSCDPPSMVFTIRNVCGIGARETFRKMTGNEIIGLSFSTNDPSAIDFIRIPTLHRAYGTLYNALFGQMPYLLCKQLEETLDLDEIYILGLLSQDQLLGCATILLKKRHEIPNPGLVEAFIRQSSLVLAWRRADESLRESEARFRAIVEDQTEFVTRFLTDGTLTYVNGSYARFMRRDHGELVGTMHHSYIISEIIPALEKRIQSADLKDLVTTAEFSVLSPTGSVRWLQWTVRALPNSAGKITGYQGIGRDITELHEADDSIREQIASMEFLSRKAREFLEIPASSDMYHAIVCGLAELVPDATIAISSFDPHTNSIMAREVLPPELPSVFFKLTGETLTEKPFIVSDPDALARMKDNQIRRIPGDLYYALFGAVPMAAARRIEESCSMSKEKFAIGLVAQNRLLGTTLIIPKFGHALTNRNLIETFIRQASVALAQRLDAEALRQSEGRFRAIMEDQTEFVTRFLPDGTLTFVNAALCRAVDKKPEDLLGRSFFSIIPADAQTELQATLGSLSPDNPKTTIRHRVSGPYGNNRWFEWTNRAVFDDSGRVVEYDGVGRDITVLHEASSRIRKHPADIQFLSQHARGLAGIQEPQKVMAFTAQKILSVLPGSIIGVCSYVPVSGELIFRHIEGSPDAVSTLRRVLQKDLPGMAFPYRADPDMITHLGSTHLVPGSGHIGLFFNYTSPEACSRIAECLNLGRSYLMALPSSDGTMDAVFIQLEAGSEMQNPELIEAAINQAGLALARLQGKRE